MQSHYDYVVIGGGTGGSVVASRLSEGDATVLLLEAGPETAPATVSDVDAFPAEVLGSGLDWARTTAPQPGTAGAVHVWSSGKVLGGSSATNAMAHIRGHPASYDRWAEHGAVGWNYDDMLPYFKRSETAAGRDPALRGTAGPLAVTQVSPDGLGAEAFRQAILQAGYPATGDVNGLQQEGVFAFDMNIVDGRRQTTADAYLGPVRGRDNLDVIGGATVRRLRVDAGRCVAVEFTKGGSLHSVGVDGEAVVAAGSVGVTSLVDAVGNRAGGSPARGRRRRGARPTGCWSESAGSHSK
ncbi:hypothetical protein MARA_01450 (plasmid) [Mycolicibacterium arabiense]|uniref:Glucose-methanol-choline oxidoreductase N-terminal domain-containing protein n=2 Tax=Mycolicibacterium arabiense TaxID=1286181 RepID=A0A7I7RSC6_9MYCO|nr:GMC family oxidoreductase N-terminal domain-containing protein [Mycolicibacterium arabiense]BBY46715.1 hypothetical protein MARA_01450 [Mycolicibacterium arabiense]